MGIGGRNNFTQIAVAALSAVPLDQPSRMMDVADSRLTALIVDDEANIRASIAAMLQDAGMQKVLEAAEGSEALALVAEHRIAIIFCDLMMPEMDGFEFMRQLAERAPTTPLVLASSTQRGVLRLAADLARLYGLRVLGTMAKPGSPARIREFCDALPRPAPAGAA